MKLRPYHNPENVDESKVPDGWRFLYQKERFAGKFTAITGCLHIQWIQLGRQAQCKFVASCTYIVPVA